MITEGEQAIVAAQTLEDDVGFAVAIEGNRFERRRPALVDLLVGIL